MGFHEYALATFMINAPVFWYDDSFRAEEVKKTGAFALLANWIGRFFS